MKGRSGPALIGAFVVGAVALLFLGLFFFGAGLFEERERYAIYFRESVNGLNRGAPVKMRGVQIGQVSDIFMVFHPKQRTLLTRVVVEIDMNRLRSQERGLFFGRGITMEELIELGLRAQLKLQSFVTGLLYVDLDFYPDRPAVYLGLNETLPEIPAIPSSQEEIQSTIEEVVRRIQQIPFEEIAQNLNGTLKNLKETTARLERLVGKDSFQRLPDRLEALTSELQQTTATLHRELQAVSGLLGENLQLSKKLLADFDARVKRIDPLLKRAEAALAAAERSFRQVEEVASPDSEPLTKLQETLEEVEQAARELRRLAEMLQEHPESLLRGR